MRAIALVVFAVMTISFLPGQAISQGLEIGPGGVRVYGQCDELRRSCERGEGGCRRYRETCERRGRRGDVCQELRAACLNKDRLGEQGEGNCRRYRQTCR
jgi:hypothetical protein